MNAPHKLLLQLGEEVCDQQAASLRPAALQQGADWPGGDQWGSFAVLHWIVFQWAILPDSHKHVTGGAAQPEQEVAAELRNAAVFSGADHRRQATGQREGPEVRWIDGRRKLSYRSGKASHFKMKEEQADRRRALGHGQAVESADGQQVKGWFHLF